MIRTSKTKQKRDAEDPRSHDVLYAVRTPEYRNHVWICTFLRTKTAQDISLELEFLAIVDGYTLECLAVLVGRHVSPQDVTERLFDLFILKGVPEYIHLDGVAGATCEAISDWLVQNQVETSLIESGSPWDSSCVKIFRERLRVELVEGFSFVTLSQANRQTEEWQKRYNQMRLQDSNVEGEPQVPQPAGEGTLPGEASLIEQAIGPVSGPAGSGQKVPSKGVDNHSQGKNERLPGWAGTILKLSEFAGIALVVFLMLAVVLALLAPRYGWRVDTVRSASMEPALSVGSLAVTRPVPPDAVEVGDIITFRSPLTGRLTSHRVVAVEEGRSYRFRTQGDANEAGDPFVVTAESIVGKICFQVPYAGYVVHYLKSPLGFILLGLCGFALIILELSSMVEVRWKEPVPVKNETT